MGIHNPGYGVKDRQRVTFTVPSASGDYANERITFGVTASGVIAPKYLGLTALIEGDARGGPGPTGFQAEVWLPRVPDATKTADQFDLVADYFFSGDILVPAGVAKTVAGVNTISFGMGTWPLSSYVGAQIRVKSGGSAGSVTISASVW